MLKKIMPHKQLNTHTASIPTSIGSRKTSMKHLYALTYYFNLPSVFITFSPVDINGHLRLAFPSTDNIKFSANGDGFMEAIRGHNPTFHSIKISPSAL